MNRLIKILFILLFFAVLLIQVPMVSGAKRSGSQEIPRDLQILVAGNTEFALVLYHQLRQDLGKENEEWNLFFSPYSISTALAMTYAGARGDTEAQMAKALHFPQADLFKSGSLMNRTILPPWSRERLHNTFAQLGKELNGEGTERGYELHVANALWGQKGYEFLPEFLSLTQKHYGAGLQEVDFICAAEPARLDINKWVEGKTNQKIKDLIPSGVLNSLTRLVLTNAIYFKGDWKHQFQERFTKEAPFYVTAGKTVQAPLMLQRKEYNYAEPDDVQILELPYKSGQLSMIVFLPKTRDGLEKMEKSLTPGKLTDYLKKLRTTDVIVHLPKFKLTSEFSLKKILSALGMPDAFSPLKADFSGMTKKEKLFISAVLHKAFVDVNEEGTEAAAATGVVVGTTSVQMPPKEFRADHPFLFLIRDNRSESILFMGRLTNPKAKQ